MMFFTVLPFRRAGTQVEYSREVALETLLWLVNPEPAFRNGSDQSCLFHRRLVNNVDTAPFNSSEYAMEYSCEVILETLLWPLPIRNRSSGTGRTNLASSTAVW